MKKIESKYAGSPEKWVNFIIQWQAEKGVFLQECDDFDFEKFLESFPIDLPRSCVHFYAAMESLGWPNLLKIYMDDDDYFRFRLPKKIECLIYDFPGYNKLLKSEIGATLPVRIASEEYLDYSRDQYPDLTSGLLFCSYVIGDAVNAINNPKILINPLVRTIDGEWQAIYDDADGELGLSFPSFADMIVWFYLSDIGLYRDQIDRPWLDHTFDTTGLTKALFSND